MPGGIADRHVDHRGQRPGGAKADRSVTDGLSRKTVQTHPGSDRQPGPTPAGQQHGRRAFPRASAACWTGSLAGRRAAPLGRPGKTPTAGPTRRIARGPSRSRQPAGQKRLRPLAPAVHAPSPAGFPPPDWPGHRGRPQAARRATHQTRSHQAKTRKQPLQIQGPRRPARPMAEGRAQGLCLHELDRQGSPRALLDRRESKAARR